MSNALKAALWTALFTFLAVFGIATIGFLQDVASWASGDALTFPDVSVLGKAAVSAFAAAATGLVNWVVRLAQSKGALPGAGPVYDTAEK